MSVRGLGDRWLAGEPIAGVAFAHHEAVVVRAGPHVGRAARVLLLASGPPDPHFLVQVEGERRPVRVRQSALARSAAAGG